MFLRRFERRRNGKPHTYWALVESYWTGKASRQRVVSSLGELTTNEQDDWMQFCSHLNGKALKRRPERTRDFGEVWLVWGWCRMLELDDLLERLIEPGRDPGAGHDITSGRLRCGCSHRRIAEVQRRLFL